MNREVFSSENIRPTEPVATKYGKISGVFNGDRTVRAFAGVPFAAPPVGDLRWKDPRPPKAWDGMYAADHFADIPVQRIFEGKSSSSRLNSDFTMPENTSEDCLYLNIWTGASGGERRPVLVYLFGGSFEMGSGSTKIYDGEEMAKKGLVVVTVNYRVGVFGFFAHPGLTRESGRGASGNYGIMDQIAALKWIRDNIAGFGGDPGNVTVAGESAGAKSVSILMASPSAKGLFHRAIAESGGDFSTPVPTKDITAITPLHTLAQAEQVGLEFARSAKLDTIEELRSLPAAELLTAACTMPSMAFRPIMLPDTIYNTFKKGLQNDVPLLVGYNADELSSMRDPDLRNRIMGLLDAKKYRLMAESQLGEKAGEFLRLYPAGSEDEVLDSVVASRTDHSFAWQAREWARMQRRTGKSNVYVYFFDHVSSGNPELATYGASHGTEVVYAYRNLKMSFRTFDAADEELSDVMSSYWANFAAAGDPNGSGLPEWSPFGGDEKVMELGKNAGMIGFPHKAAVDFWDGIETRIREKYGREAGKNS